MNFYREKTPHKLAEHGFEFFKEQKPPKRISVRAHIHPTIELLFIRQGCFEIGMDHRTCQVYAGDLVIIRPNTVHTIANLGDEIGRYEVLKLQPSLLFQMLDKTDTERVLRLLKKSDENIVFLHSSKIPEELCHLRDSMAKEAALQPELFLSMLRLYACRFVLLLARLLPPATLEKGTDLSEKTVALIYESIQYINEHYAEDLTPDACAAAIHLSYSYYARLFRAVTGKGFKQHLIDVRMAKAHNELLFSKLPITDIALSCGYDNVSHFIAEYKRIYGITPGNTRKQRINSTQESSST